MKAKPLQVGPFKYVGGDPSIDFVNTVDWAETGLEGERLHGYADLVRWARGAELLTPHEARRMTRAAAERPDAALEALAAALELRLELKRLFTRVATQQRAVEASLGEFNRWLATALQDLRIEPRSAGFDWSWRAALDKPIGVLWPIVWAAARLLASPDVEHLGMCAGDRCGWLFVDRSRNRRRRWCEMDVCGNRAKARRHYARRRQGGPGRKPPRSRPR